MILRLHSTLRGQTGVAAVPLPLLTETEVGAALRQAAATVPELGGLLFAGKGELSSRVVVFRNGRNIVFLQGLNTSVGPGDSLDVFPKTGVQRAFARDDDY